MSCPQIAEIVIVWNNNITPNEAGFKQKLEWKRPVHFVKTEYNSMDFRYLIPKESKAQLFFSVDDDIVIECDELVKGFKKWQAYSVGPLGPLLSYDVRTFDHSEEENSFSYKFGMKSEFYSLALTGFTWIPRFYLDLYYTNKSETVLNLRSWVQKHNNCDDILLNFLISYFFPEFLPLRIEGKNLDVQTFPHSESSSYFEMENRTACIKEFTKTIGYNPAKYIDREGAESVNKELKSLEKYLIFLKYNELKINLLGDEDKIMSSLSELINKTEIYGEKKEETENEKGEKDTLFILKLKEMEANLELLEEENENYLEENIELKGINQRLYKKECENKIINLQAQIAQAKKYLNLITYGIILFVFILICGTVWIKKRSKEPSPIDQRETELNLE